MRRYYSPSSKGLYVSVVHGEKGTEGSTIPDDAIEITEAEHVKLIDNNGLGEEIVVENGKVTTRVVVLTLEEKLVIVRTMRDKYLGASDWTQYPDSPLTDDKKAEWSIYRQALRDFPGSLGTAFEIDSLVWPTAPQ